jgi:hypothetical protein
MPDGSSGDDPVRVGEPTEIANEFAFVRVRKIWTRNGERLELESVRLGSKIQLDALELESLTWQSHDTFSGFLETPFGGEA